jgi:hypothetical protein
LEYLLQKDYPDFPDRRCSAILPTASYHKQNMNLNSIPYRSKHTHNRVTFPYNVTEHKAFGVILLPSHVDEAEMN